MSLTHQTYTDGRTFSVILYCHRSNKSTSFRICQSIHITKPPLFADSYCNIIHKIRFANDDMGERTERTIKTERGPLSNSRRFLRLAFMCVALWMNLARGVPAATVCGRLYSLSFFCCCCSILLFSSFSCTREGMSVSCGLVYRPVVLQSGRAARLQYINLFCTSYDVNEWCCRHCKLMSPNWYRFDSN